MSQIYRTYGLFLGLLLICGPIVCVQAQTVKWHSFEKALAIADSTGKPLMIDVYTPWCGWCQKMKNDVYPNLAQELESFVLTRLNRDDNQTTYIYQGKKHTALELAQHFRAKQVPTIVLLSKEGDYLLHLSGFRKASELKPIIQYISSGSYRYKSFKKIQKSS